MAVYLNRVNRFLQTRHDGTILFNNERAIISFVSSFGKLRQELINCIGVERTRRFLLRYGWELGRKDAEKAINKNYSTIEETIYAGPVMHMLSGHAQVEVLRLQVDCAPAGTVQSVHAEGFWHNSYEAEEHLKRFGISKTSVCHTLIGYAEGYMSTVCGHPIVFKEVTCKGKGDPTCRWVAKSIHLCGEEEKKRFNTYYGEIPIIQELEETYEKLLEEKNNLQIVTEVHKILTEEIIKESDLETILHVVYKTMRIPIVIEDNNFDILACDGLGEEQLTEANMMLKKHIAEEKKQKNKGYNRFLKTTILQFPTHRRLLTPIFLRGRIFGYCSFLYCDPLTQISTVHSMTLERVASVCSLHYLNEKIRFETTERMKGHFFDEVLRNRFSSRKEILQKGQYINLDLEQPYYVMILKYDNTTKKDKEEFDLHEKVLASIYNYFKIQRLNVLSTQRADQFAFYIQAKVFKESTIESFCRQFIRYLKHCHPKISFKIGLSQIKNDILNCHDAYEEALAAIRFVNSPNSFSTFDKLGIIGALINENNQRYITRLARETFKSLMESNSNGRRELLWTLYIFLKHGGNLEQTANELNISISGLRYRIQKIEEILTCNLRDPESMYTIFILLQSIVLLGEIEL